jgi:hypothetical protein
VSTETIAILLVLYGVLFVLVLSVLGAAKRGDEAYRRAAEQQREDEARRREEERRDVA